MGKGVLSRLQMEPQVTARHGAEEGSGVWRGKPPHPLCVICLVGSLVALA